MTYNDFLDITENVSKALEVESDIDSKVVTISDLAFVYIDKETYQNVDRLIEEFKMQTELKRKKYRLFLIPFYIGVSNADIEDFVGDIKLPFFEYFPDFELKPADFNYAGLQAFVGFAAFLNNRNPIFNSLYNLSTLMEHINIYIESNKKINNVTTVIPNVVLDIQKKYNIEVFNELFAH